MKRRRHSNEEPIASINVTPLVDVFLVLLVIFMVAMPSTVARIMVSLPSNVQGSQQTASDETITVVIDKEGKLYVENTMYTLQGLQEYFAIKKKKGVSTLYIEADAQTNYGHMATTIGLAKSSGFTKIGFSTQGRNTLK